MDRSRESRRLPIKTASGFVLNIAQWGRGAGALVLVHGFGENNFSWSPAPNELSCAYTVFAIDLRGHGDSQWNHDGQYHTQHFLADLMDVVDQLQLRRYAIAGHSLGADLALELAALRPHQVTKLVLVEFSLDGTASEVLEFALAQFNEQFRVYRSPGEYYAFLQQQRPLADNAALQRFCENSVRRRADGEYEIKCDPAVQHIYSTNDELLVERHRAALSSLRCPTLLIRGAGSAIVTAPALQQVLRLVPSARSSTVAGAGHAVMLDRPKEFHDALLPFLLARVA
jgi:pimeloyl-ACP methyl ester carboxylesterase